MFAQLGPCSAPKRPYRGLAHPGRLRPLTRPGLRLRPLAAAAPGWSPEVVVVVRGPAQVAGAVDAPLVLDHEEVPGPLAGLAAALAYAQACGAERLLAAPCDMPRLPADLARRLEAALTEPY